MRRIALILMALAGTAEAQEWLPMDGVAIQSTLEGRILDYDTAWQQFNASGRTLYNAGNDSWGYWAVRKDQYCSQWPPTDGWVCFDMALQGQTVRFVGESGHATEGVLRDN